MSDQIRIRSAGELFDALASEDLAVRGATLRATRANPGGALAFGRHEGRDVIDFLLAQVKTHEGTVLGGAIAGVLAAFRDARVDDYFRRTLAVSRDPEMVRMAAMWLADEPLEPMRAFLSPLVLQDEDPFRARMAAQLLLAAGNLTLGERIRVALVLEIGEAEPPPLDESTADAWMKELDGFYDREARQALEAQGPLALGLLADRWGALTDGNREWLLRWAASCCPDRFAELLAPALTSGSDALALAALRGLAEAAPEVRERSGSDSAAFITHADPAVRLAAIQAGARGLDWRRLLSEDPSPAVHWECVRRLGAEEGAQAVPDLVRAITEGDWQLRAAATDALAALGEPARDAARGLLERGDVPVRTAATQVLLALGDDEWLEEKLVS